MDGWSDQWLKWIDDQNRRMDEWMRLMDGLMFKVGPWMDGQVNLKENCLISSAAFTYREV